MEENLNMVPDLLQVMVIFSTDLIYIILLGILYQNAIY